MLIEPASKVSTPSTVVILTAVKTAAKETAPITIDALVAFCPTPPKQVQVFEPNKVNTKEPDNAFEADVEVVTKPLETPVVLGVADILAEKAEYPLVVYVVEPVPSWICGLEEPFVETTLNITVIRFTQDGIEVKSIEVGLPVAALTDVPDTIELLIPLTTTLPVPAGIVAV